MPQICTAGKIDQTDGCRRLRQGRFGVDVPDQLFNEVNLFRAVVYMLQTDTLERRRVLRLQRLYAETYENSPRIETWVTYVANMGNVEHLVSTVTKLGTVEFYNLELVVGILLLLVITLLLTFKRRNYYS